ncbi:MAG TPA: hypothetical protein ENH33_07020 [Actinobacteria bacterium]|nr:hypothetical protein [Actinomycetota bacterium]
MNAGIAASDVVCCKMLGRHSIGDNHEEAVALLGSAAGVSRSKAERCLSALLSRKTAATYSGRHMGSNDIKQVSRAAAFLVQLAEDL